MNNSAIDPKTVFLVSGQQSEQKLGGREGLAPEMLQRVVVASDADAAYKLLATEEPGFRPVGLATLEQYESAAAHLRAVLAGTKTDWPMYKAG